MVYFTPSKSLSAWKVKQTMKKKKKRYWSYAHKPLKGKQQHSIWNRDFWKGSWMEGKKKQTSQPAEKGSHQAFTAFSFCGYPCQLRSTNASFPASFTSERFIGIVNIWRFFGSECFLSSLLSAHLLTFRFYIFIHVFLASAHFVFWKHAYKTYTAYYWKHKVTFRSIISCLNSDNNFATMCLIRMVLLNLLHMQDLQGAFLGDFSTAPPKQR